MKGIVFDEFNEMVIDKFGDDMLDDIIDENIDSLASGGAYTSVATYDHQELLVLVTALSEKTGIAVEELVKAFGHHLAGAFATKFPVFFAQCKDTFSFLKTIDNHIHVEVHKLYPDAELPKFTSEEVSENQLLLSYCSKRNFAVLAQGLIEATAKYYKENITIEQTDKSEGDETKVDFLITRE